MESTTYVGTAKNEHGQSMLELAIVLPVLLFLVMSIVETGRALNQYLELTHIVYEGARYAASLAGIDGAEVGGEGSPNQMKERVISRVEKLLELSGYPDDRTSVEVLYEDNLLSGDGGAANSVSVGITLNFVPLFPVLDGLSINVDATAPYLFKNE